MQNLNIGATLYIYLDADHFVLAVKRPAGDTGDGNPGVHEAFRLQIFRHTNVRFHGSAWGSHFKQKKRRIIRKILRRGGLDDSGKRDVVAIVAAGNEIGEIGRGRRGDGSFPFRANIVAADVGAKTGGGGALDGNALSLV